MGFRLYDASHRVHLGRGETHDSLPLECTVSSLHITDIHKEKEGERKATWSMRLEAKRELRSTYCGLAEKWATRS
jgi:hypothetical protein